MARKEFLHKRIQFTQRIQHEKANLASAMKMGALHTPEEGEGSSLYTNSPTLRNSNTHYIFFSSISHSLGSSFGSSPSKIRLKCFFCFSLLFCFLSIPGSPQGLFLVVLGIKPKVACMQKKNPIHNIISGAFKMFL